MRNIPLGPMWSAVTDPDLNALLHPASAFEHPREVVSDPDLTNEEKRAILSSWASDVCSVESQPAMRLAQNPDPFVKNTSHESPAAAESVSRE
jgi:hypothetical protein